MKPGAVHYFICFLLANLVGNLHAQEFRNNSVLASGDFYKVRVTSNGIYKIDCDFFKSLGADPSKIDLQTFGIFGTQTGMLSQANSQLEVDDLEELSFASFGLEDGKFDKGDYILFYAQGPHKEYFDVKERWLKRQLHLYDTANHYFITTTSGSGKQIKSRPSLEKSIGAISIYDHYEFHETESRNLIKSGRNWFGEEISLSEPLSFSYTFPGLVPHRSIVLSATIVSTTTSKSNINVSVAGSTIGELTIKGVPQALYGDKGIEASGKFRVRTDDLIEPDKVDFMFDFNDENEGGANLDHMTVKAPRFIQLYDNQTWFESAASLNFGATAFQISKPQAEQLVWDISNPLNPINQEFSIPPNGKGIFRVSTNDYKRFMTFRGSDFPVPTVIEKVEAQNLHALGRADGLIITADVLRPAAQRLADFRSDFEGLTIRVATVQDIYNEYSGGRKDITAIRNFIRSVYRKSDQLKNVLLLGEATYSYYNPKNLVPTYQSYNSVHNVHSYASDDFYGFMDKDEGEWPENTSANNPVHDMEIGIGRLPAESLQEANAVIDKIIEYETGSAALGTWRNKAAFIADDGESNKFQLQSDFLATDLETKRPSLNPDRVFVDAFRQDLAQSPVTQEINDHLQNGVLIMDFIGHGGETAWTNEGILRTTTIEGWQNKNQLPIFLTATCEFGRFDDPDRRSGAELALLKPDGGSIGMFTTTRPVFLGTNFELSKAFYDALFTSLEKDRQVRLGELMRLAKNSSESGVVNRNFSLLGDPFTNLAYPKEEMILTTIQTEEPIVTDSVFHPLDRVLLSGEIHKNGVRDEFFNGEAEIMVFDKPQARTTLGEEGPETIMEFYNRDNILFKGNVSVKNGEFEAAVVLPLDLDSIVGNAKIGMYAADLSNHTDASGAASNLRVGGVPASLITDSTPPEIGAYLNNRDFVPGDVVADNPVLHVELSDESGINLSTSRGRGVKGILDFEQEFDLTPFYAALLDSYCKGSIEYQLPDIRPGKHNLAIKAYDTYNNKSRIEIDFLMVDTSQVVVTELKYFPNPSDDCVNIEVKYENHPDDTVIDFRLFSNEGSEVSRITKKLEQKNLPDNNESIEVCKSKNGGLIENGLYYFILQMSPGEARQNRQSGRIVFSD